MPYTLTLLHCCFCFRLSNYALTVDFNFNIDPQYEVSSGDPVMQ